MDKYTIEQLRTKGTKIKFSSEVTVNCKIWGEDYDLLKDFTYSNIISFGSDIRNGKECINIEYENYNSTAYWQIYISEFERLGMLKSEEKMNKIPQYFCVKNDGTEEFKEYIKWLNNKYSVNFGGISNDYYGYDGRSNNKGTYNYPNKNDFKNNPVVFESAKEFMELVNKTNKNNTMEKPQTFKILGKEHQLKAIWQDLMDMGYEEGESPAWTSIGQLYITGQNFKKLTHNGLKDANLQVTFNLPQDYSKALEHAQKCLELLKLKEIIHSVGGKFDVKIKDGKIYHENSDITRFVEEMVDHFTPNGDNVIGFGSFLAKVKEVEFESTGCQKVVTKLSDWVELWNKYKETTK